MTKNIGTIALVIAIFIGGFFAGSSMSSNDLRGSTSATWTAANLVSQGTLKVGTNGTVIGDILSGSCTISGNAPITATTAAPFACAVAGAGDGDVVMVQQATTTSSGFSIVGASASSTAGFITISVANRSGADGAVPSSIASGTRYWVIDN